MEGSAPPPPPPPPSPPVHWFRHGRPTLYRNDERGVQYFYAAVHGTTGMPVDDDSNDKEHYGPFILEGAAAIAFDLALICAGNNQPEMGNFRALANWVALALEPMLPGRDEKKLKIMYGSFLTEAVLEEKSYSKRYPHERFQYDWGRLEHAVSNDVPNFRNEHLPHLIKKYNGFSFRSSYHELWAELFHSVLGNEMPSNVAPPVFIHFRTQYADNVARELGETVWLEHGIRPSELEHVSLINMLVKVLGPKLFRNLGSQIELEPPFTLACRYGGHLIDAIAFSMIKSGDVDGLGEVSLGITNYSAHAYQDGVMETPLVEPLLEALNEVRDEYNNGNNWPHSIWEPLVNFVLREIHLDGGYFPSYEAEEEAEEDDAAQEDFQGYLPGNDGIETQVQADQGPGNDYSSCTCKGTQVIYRLKWSCQEGHVTEYGEAAERTSTETLADGDCAARIHDEVKQIFSFVTEFEKVRTDPNFFAPPLVYNTCFSNNNRQAQP